MTITLKLFGSLREAAGESTIQVELDEGARVEDLRNWLSERNPLVDRLGDRLAASINFEIASSRDVLQDGDEVAFLPPVAGGDGTRAVAAGAARATGVAATVGVVGVVGAVEDGKTE